MIRRAVVARMDAWHNGPYGGRCPRTGGPQCSRYGAAAVTRYGAAVGVLLAARYVAACDCWDIPEHPRRWATLRALVLFARIALNVHTPPSEPWRPCSD